MVKTIRVSDEYHEWVKAHNREGETMEETLRRLTGGQDPKNLAGILSPEEAAEAKEAAKRFGGSSERFERAREAFDS